MSKIKIERLEQIIKKEVSRILQNDVKDPRLSKVIITDTKVTNDLSYALILSCLCRVIIPMKKCLNL